MNRSIPPAIRAAVLAALLAGAADASSPRNYLTVEGEVFDRLATPLPGTWIFCTGSRRASAIADSTGAFRLEIPGATLEELERSPLKIRIAARRKGWRFALADGSPELGLELKVTKDNRLSHLRLRSNDSTPGALGPPSRRRSPRRCCLRSRCRSPAARARRRARPT